MKNYWEDGAVVWHYCHNDNLLQLAL